jgi:hypothetical protein
MVPRENFFFRWQRPKMKNIGCVDGALLPANPGGRNTGALIRAREREVATLSHLRPTGGLFQSSWNALLCPSSPCCAYDGARSYTVL